MRHVLDRLIRSLEQGKPAILAAIVRSSGSAPRTSGARMLILEDGELAGSVGGGALEGACQTKAAEMFASGASFAELQFVLHPTSAAEAGMVCGGDVDVLLHRVEPRSQELFRRLRSEFCRGLRPTLLTFLPKDGKGPRLVHLSPVDGGDVSPAIREELLRKGKKTRIPFQMQSDAGDIYVEPLVHPGTVWLIGAGHVALATAKIADFTGFEVVVMDDRAEFASRERYPMAREVRVVESFENCLDEMGIDDYVVIVTRGHLHDRDVLAQALKTEAGYVGMIGSRSKREAVYASLRKEGFSDADLARVHNPIGLPIGADTPEEIAISIVGELIQVRAGMSA